MASLGGRSDGKESTKEGGERQGCDVDVDKAGRCPSPITCSIPSQLAFVERCQRLPSIDLLNRANHECDHHHQHQSRHLSAPHTLYPHSAFIPHVQTLDASFVTGLRRFITIIKKRPKWKIGNFVVGETSLAHHLLPDISYNKGETSEVKPDLGRRTYVL